MRTKHAAWDPNLPGTMRKIPVDASKRRAQVLAIGGKLITIPPTVPARKKDGSPDLAKRYTRTLEKHYAERGLVA